MRKNTPNKPFFTRFLERQELSRIVAGRTLKYPSDIDEVVTQKYPSDDDEGEIS